MSAGRRLAAALAFACSAFWLIAPAHAMEPAAWFQRGQSAYDEDRFVAAAKAFAAGLHEAPREASGEDLERAAYLLGAILFYQGAVEAEAIVAAVEGLDPGLASVARAMRAGERVEASHAL
ncbi:MAG: hypothetical protein HKP27_01205, partial [Myxococcales bacterium]|nr:hypothetical protein [Myxococcales bacterium]